jgi:ketosteroid isomerase-like protein
MSEENVEVAKKVVSAFADRDMDAVLSFMDSEVTWTTADDEPDHQTYEGHEGVRRLYAVWSELWEAGFEAAFEMEEPQATGADVIIPVRVQVRGRGSGAEVEINETYVFTFAAGEIVRVREFRTKQQALEAAGLSE